MSDQDVNIRINAITRGQEGVKRLSANLKATGESTRQMQRNWAATTAAFTAGIAVFYGAARAVGAVWDAMKGAAQAERTGQVFDNLAKSIGSSGDAMLDAMRDATQGMMSDVQLMTAASDLMATGLAKDSETAIRLSRAVGLLGVDMNQLVLELNTMKGMRLDQMGLDRAVVMAKAAALELEGMGEKAAYTEAVLQAFEEKMDIMGDISETSAGKIAMLGAAMDNAKVAFGDAALGAFDAAGGIEALQNAAVNITMVTDAITMLRAAKEAGTISSLEYAQGIFAIAVDAQNAQVIIDTLAVTEGRHFTASKASAEASLELGASLVGVADAAAAADSVMLSAATGIDYLGQSALISAEMIERAVLALSKFGIVSSGMDGLAGKAAAGLVKMDLGLDAVSMNAARATAGIGGYSAALDEATQRQQAFVDAFSTEMSAELNIDVDNDALKERRELIAEGLINKEGLANMTAINSALYQQAQAAGATAGQLALLGIATGEFTEEQARAALKAALLMEKIKQMSAAVVAGDIGYSEAVAGIGDFANQLDTASAQVSVEELAGAVDDYATGGPYTAEVDADTGLASGALNNIIDLLDDIDGRVVTAKIEITQVQPGTADGSSGGSSTPSPPGHPESAFGGSYRAGQSTWVGERGPELVTFNQPFTVHPHGKTPDAAYQITVNNYVNGRMDESAVATLTEDRLKSALRSLGV